MTSMKRSPKQEVTVMSAGNAKGKTAEYAKYAEKEPPWSVPSVLCRRLSLQPAAAGGGGIMGSGERVDWLNLATARPRELTWSLS